jgi:cation:H+ antiporter
MMVLVLTAAMLLVYDGELGRVDALVLVSGFAIYLVYLVRWGRSEVAAEEFRETRQEVESLGVKDARRPALNWLRVAFGLGLMLAGAHWLVEAAVALAREYHVSEEVIGATIVAVGTSLPELASTVAAAARGLGDIAIGNVIGSNIFNLGLVLGTAALIRPLQLPADVIGSQVVSALIFCLALIPLAYTGSKVSRWEGSLLMAGYAGFIILIL